MRGDLSRVIMNAYLSARQDRGRLSQFPRDVDTTVRESVRDGHAAANFVAIMPPMLNPTTCTLRHPM